MVQSPRVLVGCPTFEGYQYCLKAYANRVKNLSYGFYDVLLVDNSKGQDYSRKIQQSGLKVSKAEYVQNVYERIVASRNIIRQKALEGNYDFFLSLEQDVIPPLDVIERLIRHQKDVVSGVYYKIYEVDVKDKQGTISRKKTILPLIFKPSEDSHKMHVCYPHEVQGNKFFKIRACGLGCVLISRKVLEQVAFRYDPDKNTFDDFLFCTDAIEKGFELYADTSVKCEHLFLKKGNVFGGAERV